MLGSLLLFLNQKHRDEVNAKVMEEFGKQAEEGKDMSMPFDMKRMAVGGFEVVVEA